MTGIVEKYDPEYEVLTNRQQNGKFGPGNSAGGRKKGARHKLSERFVKALHDDFKEHGVEVIKQVRAESPSIYMKTISALVPRDFELRVGGNGENIPVFCIDFTGYDESAHGDAPSAPEAPVPASSSRSPVIHNGRAVLPQNITPEPEPKPEPRTHDDNGRPLSIQKKHPKQRDYYPQDFGGEEYE